MLHYLRETQKSALSHLNLPAFYQRHDHMVLDAATVRNLELVDPLFAGESRDATLINVLDKTSTGMGGRLLRRRLLNPSCHQQEIEARLDEVSELAGKVIVRGDLRKLLGGIQDLERLLAKVTLGSASPRDMLALGRSLAQLPAVAQLTSQLDAAGLRREFDLVSDVRDQIQAAISDEPPINIADGGAIRDGFNAELDELRDISRNSRQYIAAIETRERAQTGIQSLKVRFNNVFGYYIEISKANLQLVASEPTNANKRWPMPNATLRLN